MPKPNHIESDPLEAFDIPEESRLPLDEGIKPYVLILRSEGVETFESCEGGLDHAYSEPTIGFNGDTSAGWKALAFAMERGLPVTRLRYVWSMRDGLPDGPYWEMVFKHKAN